MDLAQGLAKAAQCANQSFKSWKEACTADRVLYASLSVKSDLI